MRKNVWCIVCSQFYCGDYCASHKGFELNILPKLIEHIRNFVCNYYTSLDAMSAPQIGVQIGEIHNNGTGGGNINNGTASAPGSGYP